MVPSSCMAEHNSACRLQLAGRSRRRSRSAQRVPRWQTRGALMFCTRSELTGCATPSGRREGSSGDAACCTLVRDSSTSPGSSTSCQRARSRSDHVGPAPIIVNVFSSKVPREKAERERTLYEIFIHEHGSHTVDHTANATRGASLEPLAYANAPASRAVAGTAGRALSVRSRALPGPPGQMEAEAREGRPTDGHTRCRHQRAP